MVKAINKDAVDMESLRATNLYSHGTDSVGNFNLETRDQFHDISLHGLKTSTSNWVISEIYTFLAYNLETLLS